MKLLIKNRNLESHKHFLFNCRLEGLASRGRTRLVKIIRDKQVELDKEIIENKKTQDDFSNYLDMKMNESTIIEFNPVDHKLIDELYKELTFYKGRMKGVVSDVYDDLMNSFDEMFEND